MHEIYAQVKNHANAIYEIFVKWIGWAFLRVTELASPEAWAPT